MQQRNCKPVFRTSHPPVAPQYAFDSLPSYNDVRKGKESWKQRCHFGLIFCLDILLNLWVLGTWLFSQPLARGSDHVYEPRCHIVIIQYRCYSIKVHSNHERWCVHSITGQTLLCYKAFIGYLLSVYDAILCMYAMQIRVLTDWWCLLNCQVLLFDSCSDCTAPACCTSYDNCDWFLILLFMVSIDALNHLTLIAI
jgi:hypothetical protein